MGSGVRVEHGRKAEKLLNEKENFLTSVQLLRIKYPESKTGTVLLEEMKWFLNEHSLGFHSILISSFRIPKKSSTQSRRWKALFVSLNWTCQQYETENSIDEH